MAVTFPEDADVVPAGIVNAPNLQRAVTDIGSFAVARPLPLLFDILRNGLLPHVSWPRTERTAVDFVVMTNSDIHVQPTFYCVLGQLIKQGFDVITVNRRTIDVSEKDRNFLPIFWAEEGQEHRGFDCFVFPAAMLESFCRK